MEFLNSISFLANLSENEKFIHSLIFSINVLLLISSTKLVSIFEHDKNELIQKASTFRFFNYIFIIFQIIDIILVYYYPAYKNLMFDLALSGIIIYSSYFLSIFLNHINKNKFGEQKNIDKKMVKVETYSSRITFILIKIALSFITIIFLIQFWGFNSLLETTGIFGIILGFIALTASIWAPNIMSGLFLLNSKLYNEGDIIEFDDKRFIIFKFQLFRTTLLDIENNHRTSIANQVLSHKQLDNITKLASTDGFRETIAYKIGYPADYKHEDPDTRIHSFDKHKEDIKNMLNYAWRECSKLENVVLDEKHHDFEVHLVNTGDYALHYNVSFFVKKPESTNTTSLARNYLNTKYLVNEKIMESSVIHGVDLSTPILHQKS